MRLGGCENVKGGQLPVCQQPLGTMVPSLEPLSLWFPKVVKHKNKVSAGHLHRLCCGGVDVSRARVSPVINWWAALILSQTLPSPHTPETVLWWSLTSLGTSCDPPCISSTPVWNPDCFPPCLDRPSSYRYAVLLSPYANFISLFCTVKPPTKVLTPIWALSEKTSLYLRDCSCGRNRE